MKRVKKLFHRFGDRRAHFAGNAVEFAAIAGGEHHRFLENSLAAKFVRRFERLLLSEGNAFAKFHGSGAMVAADQRDLNAAGAVRVRIWRSLASEEAVEPRQI